MLKNQQAPQKRSTVKSIQVHSIFYTIQGEGIFCGYPAIFVRLAGCNLQCPLCDTDYTSESTITTPYEIVRKCIGLLTLNRVQQNSANRPLVVITGGEPFRQTSIGDLCVLLESNNFRVQIETNGSMPPPDNLPQNVVIVCSPKTAKLNPKMEKRINAYKYVIKHDCFNMVDGLPLTALDNKVTPFIARPYSGFTGNIYLQPLDEQDEVKNEKHLKQAIDSCMRFGYILQIQVHKLIGLE